MKTIIDLVLLGILIICTWSGYKKGLIMGVGGILCIIISIYGANLLATSFAGEVVPAMRPFASGYAENMINGENSQVKKNMGWDGSGYSIDDLLANNPDKSRQFGAECYMALGIDEGSSERMAAMAVDYAEANQTGMVDAVVQILCEKVSYVGCFVLAFVLILIVFTVIGNLPNLSFKIPNLDMVNDIAGAVLGLVTGIMFCALAVWALKFMGMITGADTLPDSAIGGWLMEKDFLFKYLGL